MKISKNEKTKQNESLSMKHLNDLTDMAKMNLKDYINNLCFQLAKYKVDKTKEIENWKNDFLKKVNTDIDNLNILISDNKKQDNLNENNNNIKKEYKIESSNELNIFTSKDIQEENKEITRNFQNETYNYMNVNEKIENENVALFLKEVARISRISYNNKNLLFKLMKDKYIQIKGNISFNDENSKKEFSSWVKKFEKENGNKEYINILNQIKLFENNTNINKEKKYLEKLFYDLTIMYYHCDLAFPSIQINFTKESDFISEKMIDFINRGKNRKVNFIILPSLFSNGNYLQNGKSWVFTYYKNTFKFDDTINDIDDTINDTLNKLLENKNTNITCQIIKDKLKMDVYCKNKKDGKEINIDTGFEIPKNIEYDFIFYLKCNSTNQIYESKTKLKSFKLSNNYEIIEYKLKFGNEIIIASRKIINK